MRFPFEIIDKPLQVRLRLCQGCEDVTLHGKPAVRHWLHFGLTLMTGLWLIVWIIVAVQGGDRLQTCLKCGRREFR
ncbi:hypothetical protein FEM03_06465 [Phragmitibacter flavus]|uniref:LITAF domain-containing protein n=1 Tax=Phragmitibacter flavus TaxID=2576071 RepID=A0A5R8KHN6_9BACT|nr:hypothetical protein [Phragmitibacter flavus]TLD71777.1 hypothetical protein FEM03_06465 [Phragmitibacter flavus]